jgi:hypothetical protein
VAFDVKARDHVFDFLLGDFEISFFFFFITQGVRVNLRAPRLIPGSTEHPKSPVGK